MSVNRVPIRWYYESRQVIIPDWVADLESFRRWVDDDDFPEEGRISWLCGEVEIDMSREQLFTHGQVKTTFTVVVGGLVLTEKLGYYWSDGPRVSSEEGNLSVNPDG